MTLDKLKTGERGIILCVGESENRRRLLEMGLVPGTIVVKGRVSPFKDPCEILLRGYSLTLRQTELKSIEISEISP